MAISRGDPQALAGPRSAPLCLYFCACFDSHPRAQMCAHQEFFRPVNMSRELTLVASFGRIRCAGSVRGETSPTQAIAIRDHHGLVLVAQIMPKHGLAAKSWRIEPTGDKFNLEAAEGSNPRKVVLLKHKHREMNAADSDSVGIPL